MKDDHESIAMRLHEKNDRDMQMCYANMSQCVCSWMCCTNSPSFASRHQVASRQLTSLHASSLQVPGFPRPHPRHTSISFQPAVNKLHSHVTRHSFLTLSIMFYSHEGNFSRHFASKALHQLTRFSVLTSRKYGVATVWYVIDLKSSRPSLECSQLGSPLTEHHRLRLVATLGSKSNLKKVSRKAILDVDVAKACDTIIEPGAPMALRLSSNLLFVFRS